VLFSLDADFRDAALATRLYDARASLALLPGALRDSGLPGPTPRGAYFLRLTRRRSFALAFGKLVPRGLNLRSRALGSPNADLTHWTRCGQGIRLYAASTPGQTTNGSDLGLTRASPLSTLSIPVAPWRRGETNNFLVYRTKSVPHAGLLRDVDAGILRDAVDRSSSGAWDHAGLLGGAGACVLCDAGDRNSSA